MYTNWDTYVAFRKAQAEANDRGYRLPKDWESHWKNKLNKTARKNIQAVTDNFNTKWSDISLDKYFEAGFEIWKNFSYHQFLNKKVVEMYKRLDKNKKRNIEANKKEIIDSIKFVMSQIDEEKANKLGPLRAYCWTQHNMCMRQPIKDYVDNNISAAFLVWLMMERYIVLTDEERGLIPYVTNNFRTIKSELYTMKSFMYNAMEKIMKKYNGSTLTEPAPSGNILHGTETREERDKKNKEYKDKNLNE